MRQSQPGADAGQRQDPSCLGPAEVGLRRKTKQRSNAPPNGNSQDYETAKVKVRSLIPSHGPQTPGLGADPARGFEGDLVGGLVERRADACRIGGRRHLRFEAADFDARSPAG